MSNGTLHFKTNTLLKNLVGKDLINDDNLAIVELVKNSYDAGSSKVSIIFENFDSQGFTQSEKSRIIIADKGSGMDKDDIVDKWLNIAYSDKKEESQRTGKFLAGNKGIGRFSCDRLGSELEMLTRRKKCPIWNVSIDWSDFEKEGEKDLQIQEIAVNADSVDDEKALEVSGITMPQSGTVLVISKLRSKWGYDDLLSLKRSLEKFINPNQTFQKKKFTVDLQADYFKESDNNKEYRKSINGPVRNLIFEDLSFKTTYIESTIDNVGETIETKLYHDGIPVYRVREKCPYTALTSTHIVVYYLNPYKKAYFTRQTGFRAVEFGSIFLFLNGFRISPYGERGDDWLGLDNRRTQGHARYLGTRDVIGRIEVTGSEEQYKPISSREGLKATEEFELLKGKFFLDVFRRLERFVVDGLNWDSIPSQLRQEVMENRGLDWELTTENYAESWDRKKIRISKKIMNIIGLNSDDVLGFWIDPNLLESLVEQRENEVEDLLSDIERIGGTTLHKDLGKSLKRIRNILRDKENRLKESQTEVSHLKIQRSENIGKIEKLESEKEEVEAQVLFLKSVSTLDEESLINFHHQICLDSDIISNYLGRLMHNLQFDGSRSEALRFVEKIGLTNSKILATAQYAAKANFKSGSKKEPTDIPSFISQYVTNVAGNFVGSGLNIRIINNLLSPFKLKARKIELSILIDNLISNSVKQHAKNMLIEINSPKENRIEISFLDDGKGLPKNIDPETVFERGVTTTAGSGLGLFHVKQIVESMDGSVQFAPIEEGGAKIVLRFTK